MTPCGENRSITWKLRVSVVVQMVSWRRTSSTHW